MLHKDRFGITSCHKKGTEKAKENQGESASHDNKRKFSQFKKGSQSGNKKKENPPKKSGKAFVAAAETESKGYAGSAPKCNRCGFHHTDFSFISLEFKDMLGLKSTKLDVPFTIELTNGKVIETDKIIKGCSLELGGQKFKIDLMPVQLGSFDIVVGMDWLSNNQADVVCYDKIIRIPLPNNETLLVHGEKNEIPLRIISCMKTRKCLRKGCIAFLAHIVDKIAKELKLVEIPVVKELPEVFPGDFSGIPPQRQVEFRIDLIPGAAPVEALKSENVKAEMLRGMEKQLEPKENGALYFMNRIWIPRFGGLRDLILDEAHKSKYSIHPGADKMYHDLMEFYWWPNIKGDIATYVGKCLTCAKVKAEYQKPSGLLQQPEIPNWKSEHISMDFVTKLPRTSRGHDMIWVIVDRLTKSAHFLPIREKYSTEKLVEIYLREIVARHGVPVSIISDRDGRFISRIWQSFQKAFGSQLNLSTTFHPQTDGQSERTIQNLEDMLRACVLLKVSPWKGVARFGKQGKLIPRYIGPYEILEKIGNVAYKLKLPETLSNVHDTFHVSNLKKCLSDESLIIPPDEIHVDEKLNFIEEPVEVLDSKIHKTRRSRIKLIKVRWNSKRGPEFTWERKEEIKKKYPHFFKKVPTKK
ncbi:uncharacterized protein LOC118486445 [Helianthus annuus]|uniref:uncharacterized protein LOC118486445 n=1 Tax=Helianthus annuus TaxID=4232 RepID=UPI0016533639|nr:uncharacterized protein LOC118486445 [Helianthus annuus]